MCGPLVSGTATPKLILVSDLPLRGGPRFVTPQMSAAILHVLRRRGFRAGAYPVAFQSCDHSTAQGLFDERKCAANAKAYAANADVIGVVGPFNSGCAHAEIPIANRASLPIVSPTNSDVGLTRQAFGAPRGALRALYPTGRHTYVRLMSPDDMAAAAAALLAQQLGATSVLVRRRRRLRSGVCRLLQARRDAPRTARRKSQLEPAQTAAPSPRCPGAAFRSAGGLSVRPPRRQCRQGIGDATRRLAAVGADRRLRWTPTGLASVRAGGVGGAGNVRKHLGTRPGTAGIRREAISA